ncbi:hypothetical protein B9Z55_004630 [Caenorhabditis nigoni]|nr:hypothetical protein B9Z55_004630 [Caenorhabditis nigoni]
MKSIDLGFWADESLSPESESKLYQVEYIKINQLNRTNPAILRNFQGKQAIIDCYVLETSDLIDFVNRWKSGEAYHKLEYLTIRKYREEIPRDEILAAIGARHIDATRKPPAHSVPRATTEMKLLKYPRLVQDQILNYTVCSDLFLLSLLSKKMKTLIKSSQMPKFKHFTSIVYDSYTMDHPLVYLNNRWISILQFREYAGTENGKFQLNISGKLIDFRSSDKYNCPVALFHPHGRELVIESIHNHFLDLFGTSVNYQWRTYNYKLPIPRLQNLSVGIRISIPYRFEDLKNVDNFLSSHPVLKSIDLDYLTDESLSPESESRLYQAESIEISQYDPTTPAVLRNFQGRQAFLLCYSCDVSHLIEFVSRWKSGKAFQNLEHLKIRMAYDIIPRDEILTAIEARHIDATRKPPTHTIPKAYIEYAWETHTDPIISHTYVVRESDNRVASVLIEEKTLSFGVWDKTEEEFLGMVDKLQLAN